MRESKDRDANDFQDTVEDDDVAADVEPVAHPRFGEPKEEAEAIALEFN